MSCMYRFYDSFFGEDPDCIDMMFESLPIIGKTSMGVWVDVGNAKKKFINMTRAKNTHTKLNKKRLKHSKNNTKDLFFKNSPTITT